MYNFFGVKFVIFSLIYISITFHTISIFFISKKNIEKSCTEHIHRYIQDYEKIFSQ